MVPLLVKCPQNLAWEQSHVVLVLCSPQGTHGAVVAWWEEWKGKGERGWILVLSLTPWKLSVKDPLH